MNEPNIALRHAHRVAQDRELYLGGFIANDQLRDMGDAPPTRWKEPEPGRKYGLRVDSPEDAGLDLGCGYSTQEMRRS